MRNAYWAVAKNVAWSHSTPCASKPPCQTPKSKQKAPSREIPNTGFPMCQEDMAVVTAALMFPDSGSHTVAWQLRITDANEKASKTML